MSYLKFSSTNIEYTSLNDDAAEKEDKKIESEYLDQQIVYNPFMHHFSTGDRKLLIPHNFFVLAYFPEVLTPPPSV